MLLVTQTMNNRQSQSAAPRRGRTLPVRVAAILLVAVVIGWMVNRVEVSLEHKARPAGFGQGILQGVMMPMALPNLLLGKDVPIYSARNTGLTYKLGYTAGVNGCGAIFFGLLFWRLNRWRRQANGAGKRDA